MARIFVRLERVLDLEAQQGYQDKAVVGGIRQFVVYWVGQAREEAVDEADRALIEQVAEALVDYGRLPGGEARARVIESLMEGLGRRKSRLGIAVPDRKEPPVETKPVTKKTPPKKPAITAQKAVKTRPPAVEPAQAELPAVIEPDPQGLAQPVLSINGVGPKIAEKLQKLGVTTILDLLYLFPRRYDDYTLMKPINKLQYGEQVTIIGTIWQTRAKRTRNNKVMVQTVISDGTGSVQITWFNQPWIVKQLPAGMQIVISGKVEQFLGRPVFNSPEWEPLELEPLRTRRIVPVYPLTEGLGSRKVREIVKAAVSYWAPRVPDVLPQDICQRQRLYALPRALQQIHFPDSQETLHDARRRLAFDELFLLQLGMQNQRHQWRSQSGIPIDVSPGRVIQFRNALPFPFTDAQQRVIDEIVADITHDVPMNRLLQGDVGAGKTVVAAAAMFATVSAGTQTALMAPTEILSEQHYRGLSKLLSPLGVRLALLTGSTAANEKAHIYAGLADGSIQMVIGTHALIQEGVTFKKLGLAVIDEQHRFGVDQRGALRQKGVQGLNGEVNPHLLVMSATPIPRTLALSYYGDLDLSILDEMPPGRQEIKTRWLHSSERERAYSFIRRQAAEGRQAYIIFPLVEESEKIQAKAAVAEYEVLQKEVFPMLKLGLVHGRMKSEEKEEALRAFYEGEIDVLVATSVIEVGVDAPNSTVMVIEGANRFGLAQLHQFRGRVGRGEYQSYCILIADEGTPEAEERLLALEKTNDGFLLAEKDLELRGPGEFFGRRQSGLPELQLASLLDMEMLQIAQEEAVKLFEADPELQQADHAQLRERVGRFWEKAGDVS
ncbi:MAG: ATP-dependent DNA helicase RecG [Anaerolineaceae bacterium]|nr:MAG: ATP-dependent DNA helicase RecG [Anaerolineaceae bacterium]